MKNNLLFILCFISFSSFSQQKIEKQPTYKGMMYDMSINYNTVCDSADAYFKSIDKDKKGSGYKPFMRWKNEAQLKYGTSGNRLVDYYLPFKEFKRIKKDSKAQFSQKSNNTPSGWTAEGPFSIGNVTGHQTPGLGRLEFVKVNPTNKNQIYLGSRSSGLFRTNDEGQTWANNSGNLPAGGVNCFDSNPSNFNEILFNVQSGDFHISFGIYRSIDGGNTITQSAFNPTNLGFGGIGSDFQIYGIKYHPLIPNLVFISTSKGFFKSTDNLATYTLLDATARVRDLEFHSSNSAIIYAYNPIGTLKNKIVKSTDTGNTFIGMNDLPLNNNNHINITTVPTNPSDIYLISETAGIYKSTDEGTNFNLITTPITGINFWDGTPKDTNPNVIIAGYVDLYKSTNGGTSFSQSAFYDFSNGAHGSGSNQTKYNNSQIYVHADTNYKTCVNGVFYACTDGFLCKSEDDGTTWQKLTTNISLRENYRLGINQSNVAHTILGSQDNGTSLKNENGWYEIKGSDGAECFSFPLNENNLIFSTQNGGRYRSYNLGNNISNIKPTLDTGEGSDWLAPLLMNPNDHYTLYSFHRNVYKSTDFGTNWTKLTATTPFGSYNILHAAIAENNSNKIVISSLNKIALSNDGGVTFTSILNNLPSNLYISKVAFDPDNDNTILATYADVSSVHGANKVFISTNSGASWTNITYNLGFLSVRCVLVAFGKIYVGTEIGIYYKTMTGTTWTPFNTDLPNVPINDLEVNYGANIIKAATWGRGLFSNKILERENFPSIVKTVISNPVDTESPKITVAQFVTSTINYSGTLSEVYVSWAIGSPNFNTANVIPMSLVSGNVWKSNTSLPVNEPVGTRIYFKVTAVGSNADISETYKFMYELKPFQYCAASPNGDGSTYIKRFRLSNLDNNNTGDNGYTNYTTTAIVLNKNSNYSATANFGYIFANGSDFYAWIDYNKDSSFSADEKIINLTNIPTTPSPYAVSGNFTVPNSAVEGFVQMRIRAGYFGDSDNSCANSLGEVEDYLVKIEPSVVLSNPVFNLDKEIVVYPNPFLNQLTIESKSNTENIYFEIINLLGQTIHSGRFIEKTTFQTDNFASGTYFVKIKKSDSNESIKLIKI